MSIPSKTWGRRIYKATVKRVHSPELVEVVLQLGFKVQRTATIRLENVDVLASISDNKEVYERAQYCLIRMAAGRDKRMFVIVDDEDKAQRGGVPGLLYRRRDRAGSFREFEVECGEECCLDIGAAMTALSNEEYPFKANRAKSIARIHKDGNGNTPHPNR